MISTDFSYPYLISSARDKEFGVEKKGKDKDSSFSLFFKDLLLDGSRNFCCL